MRQIQSKNNYTTWKFILFFISLFFCFVTPGYAIDVTLRWDANTEPDMDGYRIYYKTDFHGPPYNGMGATEGDSPITITLQELYDPEQPEYTIHGLDDNATYYLVLSAYDIDGHESGYSNEVCFNSPDCNAINSENSGGSGGDETSVGGGGSGGGGGGCFIATVAYSSLMEPHIKILHEFRDRSLLTNKVGKTLRDLYCKYSLAVADFINKHPNLRAMVCVSPLL